MSEQPEKTWTRRMAQELVRVDTLTAELAEVALEAAGELKAVRLKVLLAQALEIIAHSMHSGNIVRVTDDYVSEVEKAVR